ncbi:hypothetical protein OF829_13865 [Sphingomonas sp. LB-2]|uniref:hypothetical protein n=1 Tax=Sphingomonas caeni TaxID=2984949 RepID=UPI002231BEF8|nr:hypothetical protein [Sphingomonas caeni]MCW3848327.1 hypothetical protein [Sphingomonas caeni]
MRGYLFLAPLLLIASPASAQFWGGPSGSASISGGMPRGMQPATWTPPNRETDRIRHDIRDGRESGQLSRREARQLRRESWQIDRLESRYGHGGLSDSEAAELATRRQLLREDVFRKRSGS